MEYCGIVPVGESFQLCVLQEGRTVEPPERLQATFYEPGPAHAVAAAIEALGDTVVAIGVPRTEATGGKGERTADSLLERAGVAAQPFDPAAAAIYDELADAGTFHPEGSGDQGAATERAEPDTVVETNVEGVFCSLQERRLPARRHPLGTRRRVTQLIDRRVVDAGGDLWHRRIEEIDAAAAALCAHRLAVGRARWIGDPAEGVIVLPGVDPLRQFATEGVLPPVARLPLPDAEPRRPPLESSQTPADSEPDDPATDDHEQHGSQLTEERERARPTGYHVVEDEDEEHTEERGGVFSRLRRKR